MDKTYAFAVICCLTADIAMAGAAIAQLAGTTQGTLTNVTAGELTTVKEVWGNFQAVPHWSVTQQNWYYIIRAANGTTITSGKIEGMAAAATTQKTLDEKLDKAASAWTKKEADRIAKLAYYDSIRPSMNGRVY